MRKPRIDLTGQKFGLLTAIEYRGDGNWLFRCDCGNEKVVRGYHATHGETLSCGCERYTVQSQPKKDVIGKRLGKLTCVGHVKHDKYKFICDCGKTVTRLMTAVKRSKNPSCGCELPYLHHGYRNTATWNIWYAMNARCRCLSYTGSRNYAQRGIKVCERWQGKYGFSNFLADMGERPSPKHSIDRIDVNGNYEPSNCRWATDIEQANNRRNNIYITHNDETHTLAEWCEKLGVKYGTANRRYRMGCTFEEIFSDTYITDKKRVFTNDEVKFIRNFKGGFKDCVEIMGKRLTHYIYYAIRRGETYKDVI